MTSALAASCTRRQLLSTVPAHASAGSWPFGLLPRDYFCEERQGLPLNSVSISIPGLPLIKPLLCACRWVRCSIPTLCLVFVPLQVRFLCTPPCALLSPCIPAFPWFAFLIITSFYPLSSGSIHVVKFRIRVRFPRFELLEPSRGKRSLYVYDHT